MTLMENVRIAIQDGRLEPIFTSAEVRQLDIEDIHHNLSNYDKKNTGSSHKKVLISRKINDTVYYAFDNLIN